jgi:hypothetical protein
VHAGHNAALKSHGKFQNKEQMHYCTCDSFVASIGNFIPHCKALSLGCVDGDVDADAKDLGAAIPQTDESM